MSWTSHASHEVSVANCIACHREDMAELDAKEAVTTGRTGFPQIDRQRRIRAALAAVQSVSTEALEAGAIAALVMASRALDRNMGRPQTAGWVALRAALKPWREVTP